MFTDIVEPVTVSESTSTFQNIPTITSMGDRMKGMRLILWLMLLAPENPIKQVTENMTPPKVAQRITDVGFYYHLRSGGEELGPFTVEDEENPELDKTLTSKFGVDFKEILAARLYEIRRLTSFDEVADVLGCTIRHDQANKVILFCGGLLTFTDEDQFNILMSGESASGKSYTAQEVVSYFPSDVVRWIGGASPSAFFHDENLGKWDSENHVLRVDLRQKIIIFLDQPGYQLMEKLRPLLSHDRRELVYKITDKSKRGSLRTKNVVLVGYPTVILCAQNLVSMNRKEPEYSFCHPRPIKRRSRKASSLESGMMETVRRSNVG